MSSLRQGEDRLVEIELGRYDEAIQGKFDQVPMRLGQYLDWLDSPDRSNGLIGDRQVYLAQWRAHDEVRSGNEGGYVNLRLIDPCTE